MADKKTPAEMASIHRRSIEEAMKVTCAAMDAARQDGFVPEFQVGYDEANKSTRLMNFKLLWAY
jgi:hypothetical protein